MRVSREDKARLLRIAKRPRRGPFNSVMDPAEDEGSAMVGVSEAVKSSGEYDVWGGVPKGEGEEEGVEMEGVEKKPVKVRVCVVCVCMFLLLTCGGCC